MILAAAAVAICGVAGADEHPDDDVQPSECNQRSVDGCLCVDEDRLIEWRSKALAYEELTSSPPVICVEDEGTGSRTLWAALTGVAVVLLNFLVGQAPSP